MEQRLTIGDGGIETALESRLGMNLPEFEAFALLGNQAGREALRAYYLPFLELAERRKLPIALDTPTWRANPDWIAQVEGGRIDIDRVAQISADGAALVREYSDRVAPAVPVTVNGVVGPRWDDYVADQRMTVEQAERYHSPQVHALAEAGVDRVTSVTTLDVSEGLGVVRAAVHARVPVVVSFMVGADGRLADGMGLADAIAAVDETSDGAPIGYAVNCAHPEEVLRGIDARRPETARLFGFRLNAARHDEEGAGDSPEAFAAAMARLAQAVPNARLYGGCCGTDSPHIDALAEELAEAWPRR